MTRAKLTLLCAFAAFAAAGCGGGGTGTAVSSGAAEIVPENVAAYVTIDTDFDSAAWNRAQALLDRFPDKDDLLRELRKSFEDEGLSWERDVKPALGDEVDFAWIDFEDGGNRFVGVTKPKNVDKFNSMLESGSDPAAHEQIDGWTVFAEHQDEIDRFKQARDDEGSLEDDSVYSDATDGLPEDAIATAFVRGSNIQSRLDRAIGNAGGPSGTTADQFGTLDAIGAAVTPESDGIRLDAALNGDLDLGGGDYRAELPDAVPAGAIMYLSFRNVGARLHDLIEAYGRLQPNFDQQRSQVETALGMRLDDVLDLLRGEGAFALYPTPNGAPTVLFAVRVDDEDKARRLIDKSAALTQLGGSGEVRHIEIGSISATEFVVSGTTVYAAVSEGKLIVASARVALEGMGSDAKKLSDDSVYTAALEGASMPDETGGFLYLNLRTGLNWGFSYAEDQGSTIPEAWRNNLAPLRGLLLYSAKEGDSFKFSGFLGIE